MQKLIGNRWFELSGLILVIGSIISLYLQPRFWIVALVLPIAFWSPKLVSERVWSREPLLSSLLIVFVLTAAIGYWAAYNQSSAWNKFCLIIAAVLFYLMIVGQSAENLKILSGFWFIVGAGIASYFLLTHDFSTDVAKIPLIHNMGMVWMKIRPVHLELPSIQPNDASGISIIAAAYGLYFYQQPYLAGRRKIVQNAAISVGFGIVLLAVLLASSRGAFVALIGTIYIWIVWQILHLLHSLRNKALLNYFPQIVILSFLCLGVIFFIVLFKQQNGPSMLNGGVSTSRGELFRSGVTILRDFPFTGGGLDSFPGLYSQYVLVIPFYSILNSHNMFLDVMIEQGIIGGISFLLVYLIAAWRLLSAIKDNPSSQMQALYFGACISLFTAIIHGTVDDYIYGGRGTILTFVPAGMAILISSLEYRQDQAVNSGTSVGSSSAYFKKQKTMIPSPWFVLTVASVFLSLFIWRRVAAQWYANLGAVEMAKVELKTYPSNTWYYGRDFSRWKTSEAYFQRALAFDADNRTANYRLGLIKLNTRDFASASSYLMNAYDKDSTNRGVIKNLGYTYVWLGDTKEAQALLEKIPEAQYELSIYAWWWNTQNRVDLGDNASIMLPLLESSASLH